jgi:triosephosphate isomerase
MLEGPHVKRIFKCIRSYIESYLNDELAESVRIIYAGEVKAEEAAKLITLKDVDGFLVNYKNSMTEEFANIVKET